MHCTEGWAACVLVWRLVCSHTFIHMMMLVISLLQLNNISLSISSRPHPPEAGEPKPMKRTLWEWVHKFTGKTALILALINISLGVFLAVTSLLLWTLWFAYMGVLLLVHFFAECNRKCTTADPLPPPRPAAKYILRDKPTSSLFGDKHHGYDNAALESEG